MSKTALFAASKAWDADRVSALATANTDLTRARDSRGRTALQLCAARPLQAGESPEPSTETARALLAAGSQLDAVHEIPDDGEVFPATALWYAIARGRNRALAACLLHAGANPDHCLWAVVWSGDLQMAKLLLAAGARTELRFAGETPLLYAARLEREPLILELVRAKANVDVRDSKGKTPLDYARKKRLGTAVIAALGGTGSKLGDAPHAFAKIIERSDETQPQPAFEIGAEDAARNRDDAALLN